MKNMIKKILLFGFLSLSATTLNAKDATKNKINLGSIDYKQIKKQYSGFENSFNEAFIGIPSSLLGTDTPFYGSLSEAKQKYPDVLNKKTELVTVVYMHGSGKFSKGNTFREWITGDAGYIFFAPKSHVSEYRPTYSSPVPKEHYEKVHNYRQAEITQFIDRLSEVPFVNKSKMFLMGNSEGAFAAARYAGKEFMGRIVLSWSCEPGYYTDYPKVGASFKKEPFLNIMGLDDAYFGKNNPWNNSYDNEGHCGDALFRFDNAKVVLLPKTGHNVMTNRFTKQEVLNFIEMFKSGIEIKK